MKHKTRHSSDHKTPAPIQSERIHKILSQIGVGSRREIESWIRSGRVSVNGKPATIGQPVTPRSKIAIDGKPVRLLTAQKSATRVLAYHKQEGELSTRRDPEGRPTVFDRLPLLRHSRWIQVGRLDMNTSGLLLFTNDGELAQRLMHPSHGFEREYAVRVYGDVTKPILQRLQEGVELEDGLARFVSIRVEGGSGSNHWFHVTLTEGRNREVRRLWESQGLTVSRLIRVRFGPIQLSRGLRRGMWRELSKPEINTLYTDRE